MSARLLRRVGTTRVRRVRRVRLVRLDRGVVLRRLAAAVVVTATVSLTAVSTTHRPSVAAPEERDRVARRWLPAPLRIVDTDRTSGDALAAPLREAGFGVEVFDTRAAPENADGGLWWFTNASLNDVSMSRLTDILDSGGRLLLDGLSPAAERLIGARNARGTSRAAVMNGVTINWDVAVHNVAVPAKAGDVVLARTTTGVPALIRRGDLLWSMPRLDRGAGLRRLTYLPQVLRAMGLEPRTERNDIELYVDPDLEYPTSPDDLARRWKQNGVSRVYVSAWKDDRLTGKQYDYDGFITAMHGRGIEVFAWVEWPHVNFSYFKAHPYCREVSATGRKKAIFWREHAALEVPQCYELAFTETKALLDRYDFDGINLAELYFESVADGPLDPDTYTPFHPEARAAFEEKVGFDPIELMREGSPHFWRTDRAAFDAWVAWRTELVTTLHQETIRRFSRLKAGRQLLVTVIDDRYQPDAGRDPAAGVTLVRNIGLDSRAILALRAEVPFEVQIEDPYLFWSGDPRRYEQLGPRYGEVSSDDLVLDINVVDRGPELPEEITTPLARGVELYTSVASVGRSRARLAIYASKTVAPQDFPWLKYALAGGSATVTEDGGVVTTDAVHAFSLRLVRPARAVRIDGERVTLASVRTVVIPPGRHQVELEG